jgi:hypothetical protein
LKGKNYNNSLGTLLTKVSMEKTAYKFNLYFGNSKNLTKSVGILHTTYNKRIFQNLLKNTGSTYKNNQPLFGTWVPLVSGVDF